LSRSNDSAGKRWTGKRRKGNPWLLAALGAIQHGRGAQAACYLRIMRHRLGKKAVAIVATFANSTNDLSRARPVNLD
jgi:hypothetical protein